MVAINPFASRSAGQKADCFSPVPPERRPSCRSLVQQVVFAGHRWSGVELPLDFREARGSEAQVSHVIAMRSDNLAESASSAEAFTRDPVVSAVAIFRQLAFGGLIGTCIVESLLDKELFYSTIAFVVWKKSGQNLESPILGRHPEHNSHGKVVTPDALDAGVFDLCRPHLERHCGKYHRVVIEQQVVCNRNSAHSDNEGQCYGDKTKP
jgi:hypothetical protein